MAAGRHVDAPPGAGPATPPPDPVRLEAAGRLLAFDEPGRVVELRALGFRERPDAAPATMSGYYDEPARFARDAARLSPRSEGTYLTLNEIDPALLARRANRCARLREGEGTADAHVRRRRWLPVDCDPVRPKGISATEAERAAASERAGLVARFLAGLGFPDPVRADSGNGTHLLYRIDEPAEDGGLVRRCLQALALRFDDAAVLIDQSTHNPARIWKAYGSVARKGEHLAARPHRLATILSTPEPPVPVSHVALERLAAGAPKPEPRAALRPADGRSAADPEAFIRRGEAERGWRGRWGPWQAGRKYVFAVCPFVADHTDRAAYFLVFPSGALAFGCHHNSCQDKGWPELKALLVPPREGPGAAGALGGRAGGAPAEEAPPARPATAAEILADAVAVVPPLPAAARPTPEMAAGARATRRVWLDPYVAAARGLSPRTPDALHEACGLFALFAALARRVHVRVGAKRYFPALFFVFVARSTLFAKTEGIAPLRLLLRAAGLERYLLPGGFTPQALTAELALRPPRDLNEAGGAAQAAWLERHRHGAQRAFIRDEVAGLLEDCTRDYNAGLLPLLLKLDGAPAVLDAELTLSRGLVEPRDVCVSLLGATTPAALREHMQKPHHWHNGLFGRLVLIAPRAAPRWVLWGDEGAALEGDVVTGLRTLYEALPLPRAEFDREAADRGGDAGTKARIVGAHQVGYDSLRVRLSAEARGAWNRYGAALFALETAEGFVHRLDATYGRLPAAALAVALALAAAEWVLREDHRGEPALTLAHWAAAQEIAERWRHDAHALLAAALRDDRAEADAAAAARLVDALVEAGGPLPRRDLLRRLHWTASTLDTALEAAGERVRQREVLPDSHGGRPAQWVELAGLGRAADGNGVTKVTKPPTDLVGGQFSHNGAAAGPGPAGTAGAADGAVKSHDPVTKPPPGTGTCQEGRDGAGTGDVTKPPPSQRGGQFSHFSHTGHTAPAGDSPSSGGEGRVVPVAVAPTEAELEAMLGLTDAGVDEGVPGDVG
jgi:hypothetical protein